MQEGEQSPWLDRPSSPQIGRRLRPQMAVTCAVLVNNRPPTGLRQENERPRTTTRRLALPAKRRIATEVSAGRERNRAAILAQNMATQTPTGEAFPRSSVPKHRPFPNIPLARSDHQMSAQKAPIRQTRVHTQKAPILLMYSWYRISPGRVLPEIGLLPEPIVRTPRIAPLVPIMRLTATPIAPRRPRYRTDARHRAGRPALG